MKKVLLQIVVALSLLSVSSLQAIIWARQVWKKSDGKTVELLFDTHAAYFLDKDEGVDQNNPIIMTNVALSAQQQQHDILWNASLHGSKVKVWVEDMASFELQELFGTCSANMISLFKNNPTMKVCSLNGLSLLCKQRQIPCTNVEFRNEHGCHDLVYQHATYDDGPLLNALYEGLQHVHRDAHNSHLYQFDRRLIHNVASCKKQHQLVVVGGSHATALSLALPLMGYKLQESTAQVHPNLQKIMDTPQNSTEVTLKCYLTLRLKSKNIEDYSKVAEILIQETEIVWTLQITHPIDIRALVEKENKQTIKHVKCRALSLNRPAILEPVLATVPACLPPTTITSQTL